MIRRASRKTPEPKQVNPDLMAKALAKSICDGDIVNFRLLFLPFSPARVESTERFEMSKYAYLLPDADEENTPVFRKTIERVRGVFTWQHIERELAARRPAQLPSELLLSLGDRAIETGKFTSAAQAYEMLRIRGRMQEEFLSGAERALDEGDIVRAARGFRIGSGLAYNYAAFPEPLPRVPDYQTRALALHGEYPDTPEKIMAWQELNVFLRNALAYLLLDAEIAAHLDGRPVEQRTAFAIELVRQIDPNWDAFAQRYGEARRSMEDFVARLARAEGKDPAAPAGTLASEIETELGADPSVLSARLLGRTIKDGEWWQYVKELAFVHPAAVLFISRQAIGPVEVLLPRAREDSPVAQALGLTATAAPTA
jgi:hypothetical protein